MIKEIRESAGLSQEKMARLTGVSQSQISRWESGSRSPRLRDLEAIRKAMIDAGYEWRDKWLWLD
jgi:transcriptional regulator with XRE-family HTH domain